MPAQRPRRKCSACFGVCHWHDTAWVCRDCGAEWIVEHDPKFAAPGETIRDRDAFTAAQSSGASEPF